MATSPWVPLVLLGAGLTAVAYLGREEEAPTEPSAAPPPPTPGPTPLPPPPLPPPTPQPPAEGPGEISPGPLPEPAEPQGGWQAVLTPQVAKNALLAVRDEVADEAASTWNTLVRRALEYAFPQNTWAGLLGGWKADARAYMIQRLDESDLANRADWPAGDDAKNAARTFWLKSSKSIAECKAYNLKDVSLATCICDLMFPNSPWPAAGTAGEPWEKKAWAMTLTKAGIV